MKKKRIINLIRFHQERNDSAFRSEALLTAKEFYESDDTYLADYIMALLSDSDYFTPQEMVISFKYLKMINIEKNIDTFSLPKVIYNDVLGILNALRGQNIVNKFLFEGPPGTGKTETVRQIARILGYNLYGVDFNMVIDSRLGQTQKNISSLFEEIKMLSNRKCFILFDEIDAIVMDRVNHNDLREMGRVTSTFLKEMDDLGENIVIFATTNLYNEIDRALKRRFDAIISFDRYGKEDLVNISEQILDNFISRFKSVNRNSRLFKKILNLDYDIPYPGEMKNIIRTSIAFSNPDNKYDYLRRIYEALLIREGRKKYKLTDLSHMGFSTRDIEIISGKSKSTVSRMLNGVVDE